MTSVSRTGQRRRVGVLLVVAFALLAAGILAGSGPLIVAGLVAAGLTGLVTER